MDIKSVPLDVLMQDLGDRPPAVLNSVETWILAAGYYPGSTRVTSTELYAKYREWLAEHPDAGKQFAAASFGKVLAQRFKRGHSKHGSFYYISTESLVELTRKL